MVGHNPGDIGRCVGYCGKHSTRSSRNPGKLDRNADPLYLGKRCECLGNADVLADFGSVGVRHGGRVGT